MGMESQGLGNEYACHLVLVFLMMMRPSSCERTLVRVAESREHLVVLSLLLQ